jgi:hypothetical protein
MKKIILIIVVFCTLTFSISSADNKFMNHSTQVSHHELELRLFDFAVNNLHFFSYGPLSKVSSIESSDISDKKIRCWAWVLPSIMNGTLIEKRERLNEFCNALFIEYQKRFFMSDLDYKKKAGEVGIPVIKMKPANLTIIINTTGTTGYPSISLAEWESGTMHYKDGFFSK